MSTGYRLVRPPRAVGVAGLPVPVLDAAQQAVVAHRTGPLVVLAGPGTGKTTTLVEAAAARVADGAPVESILMLTFGRRAAGELRDRLTTRLGRTVREPIARTFHSYAFGILRMAAVADGLPAPRLLSGPEQDLMLRELVAGDLASGRSPWPAALAPALTTRAFAGELRDLLMRAIERGLSGADLAALGRNRGRDDWVAAGAMLTQYQDVTALGRPGAYDPAELIQSAIAVLTNDPDLLATERARRRRIFVDEYQDTDPAQIELLSLLARGADELIVVGDPDQSIYGFRGADPMAMRDAPTRFGTAEVVALTTSRRSGAGLLAATRRVSERLPGPAQQRALVAADNIPPGRAEVTLLRSATEEAGYIAGVLRRAHLEDELPWSRMAVIVRSTTTTLPILRRALTSAGVPVTVRGEDLPLPDQPAVAHLIMALRCVLDPGELTEPVAEQLLLGPIGHADPMLLRQLGRELGGSPARPVSPTTARYWPAPWPRSAPISCCRRGSGARSRGLRPSSRLVGPRWWATVRPRMCCGRSGRPVALPRSGTGRAAPVESWARRPIAISTRCSNCSTPPPGSPIGCRRPRPGSSSTSWPAPRCPVTASLTVAVPTAGCRS